MQSIVALLLGVTISYVVYTNHVELVSVCIVCVCHPGLARSTVDSQCVPMQISSLSSAIIKLGHQQTGGNEFKLENFYN